MPEDYAFYKVLCTISDTEDLEINKGARAGGRKPKREGIEFNCMVGLQTAVGMEEINLN